MLEQISALRARRATLIPMIHASGVTERDKQIAVNMLSGEKAEDVGKPLGLSKFKATMIARQVCQIVDPPKLPSGNILGRLDVDLELHLTNKSANVLKQAGIFTKTDLKAQIDAGGALGLLSLHGCGHHCADEIMAAACGLGITGTPTIVQVEMELPEVPILSGEGADNVMLQKSIFFDWDVTENYEPDVDRASGPDRTVARVKVTDPRHVFGLGLAAGMMDSVDKLESLPDSLQAVPGFQLALATLRASANAARAEIIGKNLAAIARAGIDVGQHKSVAFDPNEAMLICDFYGFDEV